MNGKENLESSHPDFYRFCSILIFIVDLVRFNTNLGRGNVAGSKLKPPGISNWAGKDAGERESSGFNMRPPASLARANFILLLKTPLFSGPVLHLMKTMPGLAVFNQAQLQPGKNMAVSIIDSPFGA